MLEFIGLEFLVFIYVDLEGRGEKLDSVCLFLPLTSSRTVAIVFLPKQRMTGIAADNLRFSQLTERQIECHSIFQGFPYPESCRGGSDGSRNFVSQFTGLLCEASRP